MSLPGGIRIRIVLVLVGIVAGALGTAYMIVVPSLERRLVDARLDQLETVGAFRSRERFPTTRACGRTAWSATPCRPTRASSRSASSRGAARRSPPVADSRTQSSRDVAKDPVALRR